MSQTTTKSHIPLTPLMTRDFVLLNLAHLLQALGYTSMLLLPIYLVHLGASRAEIGLIVAVASIGGLCMRPLIGWMLDTLGRKPTIALGTFLIILGMLGIGLVTELGVMIYAARLLIGIGIGALFPAYFAFAADIIPVIRRTEGLALFGVSGLIPLLINPFATQIGIGAADLRWFLPLVGVVIGMSLVALWPIPEPGTEETRKSFKVSEVLQSLRARSLWSVWLAVIVLSGQIAVYMTFVTVSAKSRGFQDATSLWMTYAAGAVAVRVLGARLPDRIGTSNVVAPALGLYAIAMLLAASATSSSTLLLSGLLGGLGHGYCFPVLTSQLISRVPAHHRGSGLSMFTALWGVSEILVAPLLGMFADQHGDSAMFALAAVAVSASLILWLGLEHPYSKNQLID